MTQILYHAILPANHEHHVSIQNVMSNGINFLTKSNNWYGNGGGVELQITEMTRPRNVPTWVDFKMTVGVDLAPHIPRTFFFPIFTDKILIFDGDISMSISDQAFYENNKYTFDEALDFDTGKSIEYWIKKYWDSMMTLEEYSNKLQYQRPEILVFESIPKEIIRVFEA